MQQMQIQGRYRYEVQYEVKTRSERGQIHAHKNGEPTSIKYQPSIIIYNIYSQPPSQPASSRPAKPASQAQPASPPASQPPARHQPISQPPSQQPASQASQGQPEQPATSQPVKKKYSMQTRYGSGIRGQAFKNHTGLENEVGTPRQLLDVTNIFRCSYRKHYPPPKFNSSHLKNYLSHRKVVFQPPFFRGYVKLWGCRHRF